MVQSQVLPQMGERERERNCDMYTARVKETVRLQ